MPVAIVFAQVEGDSTLVKKNKTIGSPLDNPDFKINRAAFLKNRIADKDTIGMKPVDSLMSKNDSINKSSLKDNLYHYAEDYTEINERKKFIKLYNKAHIKYEDIDLSAGVIYVDYDKNEVYAGRIPDSLGKLSQRPVFAQGATKTENDSIRFNFKTKKALVWNTYTKEGEISLLSEVTKKYNDSVLFVKNVKFTTSEDREHPEYYIKASKGKIVPNKKIVVGFSQMWVEDVPTPLFIPFAFFPLTKERASGFIMPTWSENSQGFYLQNGGFYWAMSEYADLTATADIFTNGSYGLRLSSRYKKRYSFSGGLSFAYEKRITSEPGIEGYEKKTRWNIRWNHSKDSKSNPFSTFSARVNIGSSRFYRDSYNYNVISDPRTTQSNQLSSSITYNRNFTSIPASLTLSLGHNQNVNTQKISLTLPQLSFNLRKIYPFAGKGAKKNALQKINFNYQLNGRNFINTTDSLFLRKQMWDDVQMGMQHRIPVSTDMKLFKFFNLNPGATYEEVWVMQYVDKSWDATANNGEGKEIIEKRQGFKSYRNLNLSMNLSTSIYGTYLFKEDAKVQAIRHVMRPSIGFSYKPKFDQFIKTYQKGSNDIVEYTNFDGGAFGRPDLHENNTLNFGLSNSLEAKVKDKDGKTKKIKLLNSLNLSSGYNFLKDSLKLAPISINASSQIFKGMTINMSSIFDPYQLDDKGKQIDVFAVSSGGGLGRFTGFRLTTGYNFSNDTFKKKKTTKRSGGNANRKQDIDKMKKSKDLATQEAYSNPIRWSLNMNYSFNYINPVYLIGDRKDDNTTNSLSFSGNVKLTPNWNVRVTSSWDFKKNGFGYTTLGFTRELKSWVMRFTWIPIKPRDSWHFYIGIKSSILSDIKYDKHKEPFSKFF